MSKKFSKNLINGLLVSAGDWVTDARHRIDEENRTDALDSIRLAITILEDARGAIRATLPGGAQ
jgi:hypothetical protein